MRLAEERAGRRRDERPARHGVARLRLTVRALRAVNISITATADETDSGTPSRARAMNMRGTNNARNAASRSDHGVVTSSRTTSEIDVATRVDDEAGRSQTLRGEPERVTEPRAERHHDGARRDEVERRGQHDDSGEERDEQPDAPQEERQRQPRRRGQRQRDAVQADEHRDAPNERRYRRAARAA